MPIAVCSGSLDTTIKKTKFLFSKSFYFSEERLIKKTSKQIILSGGYVLQSKIKQGKLGVIDGLRVMRR